MCQQFWDTRSEAVPWIWPNTASTPYSSRAAQCGPWRGPPGARNPGCSATSPYQKGGAEALVPRKRGPDNGPEHKATDFHDRSRGQRDRPRAHPASFSQPQCRGRALPSEHPPRVLAPGVPPPALHLAPPAPGRSGRLAAHLPPSPAQPRRLHARAYASRGPRQLQVQQGSMNTIKYHSVHLSPQLPVRKP